MYIGRMQWLSNSGKGDERDRTKTMLSTINNIFKRKKSNLIFL